nr:MAG TPA: hypothetical protein [Caudoviricetes sp.]
MDSHLPNKKSNSKHHKGYKDIITRYLPFVVTKTMIYAQISHDSVKFNHGRYIV